MIMKPYTVLLLYPDYLQDQVNDTYFAHVEASNAWEAVSYARNQAVGVGTDAPDGWDYVDPEDFAVLIVIAGHHETDTKRNYLFITTCNPSYLQFRGLPFNP
jgi:hypothetical protein